MVLLDYVYPVSTSLGRIQFIGRFSRFVEFRVGGREKKSGPHRRGAAHTNYSDLFYLVFSPSTARAGLIACSAKFLDFFAPAFVFLLGQFGTNRSVYFG